MAIDDKDAIYELHKLDAETWKAEGSQEDAIVCYGFILKELISILSYTRNSAIKWKHVKSYDHWNVVNIEAAKEYHKKNSVSKPYPLYGEDPIDV